MSHKKPRSVEEQIGILKQRGMTFSNEGSTHILLKNVSYYRLKSYWWDMQQDKTEHIFYKGSCFEDVMARYLFDKELRLVLFDAIETIEIALRTKMIYYLSLSFGGLFYTDRSIFVDEDRHKKHLGELMKEFMRSCEIFAKDYKKKYGIWEKGEIVGLVQQPEAWIIFETATFGTLSKMYKNLQHQLPEKAKIAKDFNLNKHNELASWLEAISYLRNIVAHHSRIWSRNMVKRPMEIKKPIGKWLKGQLTEDAKKKPYLIITAMLYLCNAIGMGEKYKEKIVTLIKNNPQISIYKIGFPMDWFDEDIWK